MKVEKKWKRTKNRGEYEAEEKEKKADMKWNRVHFVFALLNEDNHQINDCQRTAAEATTTKIKNNTKSIAEVRLSEGFL